MTGSAPSVNTTTESTIDPTQQGLLSALAGQLGGQGIGSALSFGQVQPQLAGTQYAAPTSNLQNISLTGMENLVQAYTGGNVSSSPNNAGPLNAAVNATQTGATTPAVSMIDPNQAFQQGVVQPLTQDFNQNVIPSINGNFGRSAGGTFGTDALAGRQTAGTNLARTLAQSGSTFALQAGEANQAAQATNAQLEQSAASLLPRLLGTPGALDLQQQQILGGGLQAGGVPQATQQAQLTGEQNDFSSMLQQIQQRLTDALGLSTAGTQQTQSVVNPGSQGFLPTLVAALAGGAARGATGAGGYLAPGSGGIFG